MSESRFVSPKKMRAVFLEKPGGELVVREVNVPVPGPGEVLVKMAASPVNPSDIRRITNASGEYDLDTFIPGLEGSGRVVMAGKGLLPAFWKGRRVACSSVYPASGAWADYMVTKAAKCFPLRKDIPDEQGAMSLVNPLTALAFFDLVKKGNHKAMINNAAASSLGRMIELIAREKGIPLINIVRSDENVKLLKDKGSEYVLNSSDPSFIENLRSISSRLNATILFDSVGGPDFSRMIEALPKGSTVVIYGRLSAEEHIQVDPRKILENDMTLTGFFLGNYTGKKGMMNNLLDLRRVGRLMSGDLKIEISGRYPLERAQEAVDSYRKKMTAGKVILQP